MALTRVPDNAVQHVWQCKDTSQEVYIPPDWYEENGTPISPETGEDCEYLYTVVDKDLIP